MSKSLYSVLRIRRSASSEEIKTSYRKLALKLHPDVTKNDPNKSAEFREVHHAYKVLSDPEQRNLYDRQGITGEGVLGSGAGGAGGLNPEPASVRGVKNHRRTRAGPTSVENHQFNQAVWRAWHYGENAIIKDAVQQKKKPMTSGPHATYWAKRNAKQARSDREARQEEHVSRNVGTNAHRESVVERMESRRRRRRESYPQEQGSGGCVLS